MQDQAGSGGDDSLVDELEDDLQDDPDETAHRVRPEHVSNDKTQTACFLGVTASEFQLVA